MEGIEPSPSSRASCSVCKKKIPKGDWRYYEEIPSANFDGEYRRHWHLSCAVARRSIGASRALSTTAGGPMPQLQWGQLLCQALLNRCGKHDVVVARPLWLTLDEDGWAHLLCELDSGGHAVVTDLNGAWVASVEGSRDDALAVLPEAVFDIAVMALAHKPRTQRETTRALKSLQTKRAAKSQADKKTLGKARRAATARAKTEAKAAGVELPNISKGSRVKIIGDVQSTRGCKGKGVYGTVFWCGYGKRGTQKRVGLKSDSGDKYWADLTDVELVTRRTKKRAKS